MKFSFKSISLFLLIGIFSSPDAQSQGIIIPDTLAGWSKSWVLNANGSQASYDNWSQGGVSTLSGAASTVFTRLYRDKQFGYGFRVNLKYGRSRIKDEGVRKTDDRISIRNRFTYAFQDGGQLGMYGVAAFDTQFDKGFEYGEAAAGADSLISDFLAPVYFTQGVGLSYAPADYISFEAGLGLKQTYINDTDLSPNYGLNRGDSFRSEGGLTAGLNFSKDIAENVDYQSTVETFWNLHLPLDETDINWSNEFSGKINSFLNAVFQFELRYDADFSRDIQLKQVFAAGLSYRFH